MLYEVITIYAIFDKHVRGANAIGIDDYGAIASSREQYGFIPNQRRVTVGLDTHRRTGMTAAITATDNARFEAPLPEFINEPQHP